MAELYTVTTTYRYEPYNIRCTLFPTMNRRKVSTEPKCHESHIIRSNGEYVSWVLNTPFVFEVGGRRGPTAEVWIKTIAPTDPTERATALAHLRYELSTSLQRSNADMIITAHH